MRASLGRWRATGGLVAAGKLAIGLGDLPPLLVAVVVEPAFRGELRVLGEQLLVVGGQGCPVGLAASAAATAIAAAGRRRR